MVEGYPMSTKHQTVLLIADSNLDSICTLRKSLVDEAPSCQVVTADAGRNAVELARQNPPDAILADIRLSDMSGLKLLLKVKAQNPHLITMMMSECGSHEARKMCLEAGVDFFFEKPVDIQRLIGMLGTPDIVAESVFRGTLDNLSVPDVLQLITCRPTSMFMRIDSPLGDGCIEIENGQVIHARVSDLAGEKAFYRMVGWDDGNFEVVDVMCSEERTIAISLAELLLNTAKYIESDEATNEALEQFGEGNYVPFFPPEELAPDASHVWAPLANYARPNVDRVARRRGHQLNAKRPDFYRISAFRPIMEESKELKLRFKPKEPKLSRFPDRNPATVRTRRNSFVPAVRRIATASGVALVVLFIGARYSGILSDQHGRDIAPGLGGLISEFIPRSTPDGDMDIVRPSTSYSTPLKEAAITQRDDDSSSFRVTRAPQRLREQLPSLSVAITSNKGLMSTANSIGVSEAVFRRLGLGNNPWVEVVGPDGKTIGALAVLVEDSAAPVLLTEELSSSLAKNDARLTHVKLRQVTWPQQVTDGPLEFDETRNLSGKFCEYWYSVGLSLEAMIEAGLTPGAGAVIRGPAGDQTVRVQLYDRGQADQIWLSQPVRDAVGASTENGAEIRLFPQT